MVESFYSIARRENRRIASYVTVFAMPLSDKMADQKTANVTMRSIGGGLLESVYENAMALVLQQQGLQVETQKEIAVYCRKPHQKQSVVLSQSVTEWLRKLFFIAYYS